MINTHTMCELNYNLTVADYGRFNAWYQLQSKPYAWVSKVFWYGFYAFCICYGLWSMHTDPKHAKDELYFVVILPFTFASNLWSDWVAPVFPVRQPYGPWGQKTLRVQAEYLEITTTFSCIRYKWSQIKKVFIANDLVLLFNKAKRTIIIPVSAFASPADASEFAREVEQLHLASVGGKDGRVTNPRAEAWPPAPISDHDAFGNDDRTASLDAPTYQAYDMATSGRSVFGERITLWQIAINCVVLTGYILISVRYGIPPFDHFSFGIVVLFAVIGFAIWAFGYLTSSQFFESTTKSKLPNSELRTDFKALHLTTPNATVTTDIAAVYAANIYLNHLIIYASPDCACILPSRTFDGESGGAAGFLTKLGSAIAARRAELAAEPHRI